MKIIILILSLLGACGTIDQLDGQIDDQQNCCSELSTEAIQECMVNTAPAGKEGACWVAQCSAPIGDVYAQEQADGEITECK